MRIPGLHSFTAPLAGPRATPGAHNLLRSVPGAALHLRDADGRAVRTSLSCARALRRDVCASRDDSAAHFMKNGVENALVPHHPQTRPEWLTHASTRRSPTSSPRKAFPKPSAASAVSTSSGRGQTGAAAAMARGEESATAASAILPACSMFVQVFYCGASTYYKGSITATSPGAQSGPRRTRLVTARHLAQSPTSWAAL